jgi:hypothetical protein
MKKNYLEWVLITAGSAIIGALAVEAYKKNRARIAAEKLQAAKPKELLIIEQL